MGIAGTTIVTMNKLEQPKRVEAGGDTGTARLVAHARRKNATDGEHGDQREENRYREVSGHEIDEIEKPHAGFRGRI